VSGRLMPARSALSSLRSFSRAVMRWPMRSLPCIKHSDSSLTIFAARRVGTLSRGCQIGYMGNTGCHQLDVF
jgi:hypothetical protein